MGGGGGQKSPILRRHSLWTVPYGNGARAMFTSLETVGRSYTTHLPNNNSGDKITKIKQLQS